MMSRIINRKNGRENGKAMEGGGDLGWQLDEALLPDDERVFRRLIPVRSCGDVTAARKEKVRLTVLHCRQMRAAPHLPGRLCPGEMRS